MRGKAETNQRIFPKPNPGNRCILINPDDLSWNSPAFYLFCYPVGSSFRIPGAREKVYDDGFDHLKNPGNTMTGVYLYKIAKMLVLYQD